MRRSWSRLYYDCRSETALVRQKVHPKTAFRRSELHSLLCHGATNGHARWNLPLQSLRFLCRVRNRALGYCLFRVRSYRVVLRSWQILWWSSSHVWAQNESTRKTMDDIWCLLEVDHANSLCCHLRGKGRGMAKSELQTGNWNLYIPICRKWNCYLHAVI